MLSEKEVRHVAMLARIGLSDDEVRSMGDQLAQVLDYIAVLQQVDTSHVEPTAHIAGQGNVLRPDESCPSLPSSAVTANAAGVAAEFFRVPAVLDDNAPDLGGSNSAVVEPRDA